MCRLSSWLIARSPRPMVRLSNAMTSRTTQASFSTSQRTSVMKAYRQARSSRPSARAEIACLIPSGSAIVRYPVILHRGLHPSLPGREDHDAIGAAVGDVDLAVRSDRDPRRQREARSPRSRTCPNVPLKLPSMPKHQHPVALRVGRVHQPALRRPPPRTAC